MLATLRRLAAAPRLESEELTLRARMVHIVAMATMAIVGVLTIAMLIAQPQLRYRMLSVFAFVQALGLLVLEANRRGRVALAGGTIVAGLVLIIATMAVQAGGVLSPGVSMYSVVVLMAGILISERAGGITAVVCTAIGLTFALLETFRGMPAQAVYYSPIARWILFTLYTVMVLVLLRLANEAIAVAERRRKAVEAQLRQSQKMEALGTLAGGIAHDFNNIIGGIVGQAILGKADTAAHPETREAFESILAASSRASDIVNRILLFSRRQEAERSRMTLRLVVEDALKLLQGSMPRNVQVHTSFTAEVVEISGDAAQLFQVVVNLATNAVHAMTPDGGTLTVAVDAIVLDTTAGALSVDLRPGRHLRVTIRDTGVGMSRETLDRVFEPFFTTKGVAGTGLGLSVVHGIVKDHGGAIIVESDVGKGTTVSVYFPEARPSVTAKAAMPVAPVNGAVANGSGGGGHIMFVDDDETIRNTLPRIIKRLGYRCTAYGEPGKALAEFRANPRGFDAVLTDFTMPGMNGIELAQSMKAIRPEVPIALISGYGVDAAAAADVGIDIRLGKPVSFDVLSQALRSMLRSGVLAG